MLRFCALVVSASFVMVSVAVADDGLPPPLKKGPEAAVLQKLVGKFTTTVKTWMGSGEPTISKGKATTKSILGGLGIAFSVEGKGMKGGPPFYGHGMQYWAPALGKYESVWLDSHSHAGATRGIGTWNERTQTLTETMTSPMPGGKTMTTRSELRIIDRNRHTLTFFMTGKDGKETVTMVITYKRKRRVERDGFTE